jgi:hypothetical protein
MVNDCAFGKFFLIAFIFSYSALMPKEAWNVKFAEGAVFIT